MELFVGHYNCLLELELFVGADYYVNVYCKNVCRSYRQTLLLFTSRTVSDSRYYDDQNNRYYGE